MSLPIIITLASTGTTRTVNLDYFRNPFDATVVVNGSSSGTFTYNINFTLDDQQYLTNIGSTKSIVWYPDAYLSTASSNGTTTYVSPVAGVQMVVSAISSAAVTMTVIQS